MYRVTDWISVQAIISAFSLRACTQIQFAALYSTESWKLVQYLILISHLWMVHKRLSESINMQIEELYWKLRLVLLEPE